MAKEQTIYIKTNGVNYTKNPEALAYDADGNCELSDSTNCFIDQYGKISRGRGHDVITSIAGAHTVFGGSRQFVGIGVNLYEVVNNALILRKNNCSGNKLIITIYGGVAYCFDEINFFAVAADGSVSAWAFTGKKGANSSRPFTGPIQHTKSMSWFGRIFLLYSGIVFHSDPIAPSMFDFANNVIWDGESIVDFAGIHGYATFSGKGVAVFTTTKSIFALFGDDFMQVSRLPVSNSPLIANTLATGFINNDPVICYTVDDGIYTINPHGQTKKITENKVKPGFFNKTFLGASVVDNRYTVHGNESYTVDLETGSLEKHTVQYSAVSGGYGVVGTDLVKFSTTKQVGTTSEVTFPAMSFGTQLGKSFRSIIVSGYFKVDSSVTISDENGNSYTAAVKANTKTTMQRLNGTHKVSGQYLTLKFTSTDDFSLESVRVIPLVSAFRG